MKMMLFIVMVLISLVTIILIVLLHRLHERVKTQRQILSEEIDQIYNTLYNKIDNIDRDADRIYEQIQLIYRKLTAIQQNDGGYVPIKKPNPDKKNNKTELLERLDKLDDRIDKIELGYEEIRDELEVVKEKLNGTVKNFF